MGITPPTQAQLIATADDLGLSLTPAEVDWYMAFLAPFLTPYQALDALTGGAPAMKYPRTAYRPSAVENPYNAWYYKTTIHGVPDGPLAGKTIAIKDNIQLAGVPMINGSSILDGFVPDVDATVVTRVLDAGGQIVGKANCEAFCFSAGSHTNATGPVHNPRKSGYSAGGSSSGCAVLVASGEVDMAIGGDQGGSIRIPAAFCGAYGLKPTYGLVPYTGILPLEVTLDHTGPITRSVRDNALLLEVIAGADGIDPRQQSPVVHPYTQLLTGGVMGRRIGVVNEGFGWPDSDADSDTKVRAAANCLANLGAIVEEITIPWHRNAGAIVVPLLMDGVIQVVLEGQGFGSGRMDLYPISLMNHLQSWRQRAGELPETIKVAALLGRYVRKYYGGAYYGKARNLAQTLTAAYDRALARYDVLLMPTAPMKATRLPGPEASREEILQRAFEPSENTSPFDVTHHPALSVPCGMSEGLPIGMMLVGKHYDEPTLYQVAYAFEQAGDWLSL